MVALPRSVCLVWYSLDVFFTASTIIHLCTISIDRYFALNNPLKYHRQKRRSALIAKIVCTWLIPMTIAGPLFAFALWLDKADEGSFKGCGPHNAYFIITATAVTFFLPLLIMTVTYVLTVSTIVRQTKNAQDLNASLLPLILRPSAQAFGLKNNRRKGLLNSFSSRQSSFTNLLRPQQSQQRSLSSMSLSPDRHDGSPSRQRLLPPPSPTRLPKRASLLMPPQPQLPQLRLQEDTDACTTLIATTDAHQQPSTSSVADAVTTTPTFLSPDSAATSTTTTTAEVTRLLRVPSRVSVCSVYSDDGILLPSDCQRRTDSVSSGCDGGQKLSFTVVTENAKKSFKPTTSEQKQRMEYIHRGSKAVQVLGILFGLFVACYLPFFIAYLVDYFCVACRLATSTLVPVLEWVAYSASMLNPIVYHFFNPTFRKTFHRLMRCQCQRYGSGKRANYVFTYKIGKPAA